MGTGQITVASFPLVAYAPLHIASKLGFFSAEGLEVTLTNHNGSWSGLERALDAGEVDVALGPLWFAMRRAAHRKAVVAIGSCVRQSRFVLATSRKHASEVFSWGDLAGKTVMIPGGVPTPWFAFRWALRLNDVDLGSVKPLVGYNPDESIDEVLQYGADYVLLDIESAQGRPLTEVASLADVIGPVPWTVYCVLGATLESKREEMMAFRRALGAALDVLHSLPSEEIARTLSGYYSGMPDSRLRGAIDRYKELELWPSTIEVSRGDSERWQEAVIDCGGLRTKVDLQRILPAL